MIKILLYGNGMCSLYVTLQNDYFQGNHSWSQLKPEIILLSYEIGLIDDNIFLVLKASSENSDLPLRTW